MKTIICKILRGIGRAGKLWTGVEPQTDEVWELGWLFKTCPDTGATTHVLRGQKIEQPVEILEEAFGPLPTVFVTMGGVGSVSSTVLGFDQGKWDSEKNEWENFDSFWGLRAANWSGRIGGHVILNPIMIKVGYVSRDDLQTPRPGFRWLQTYSGSTLSEYVLLAEDIRHEIPRTSCEVLSPPARRKREVEATDPDLVVGVEDLRQAGLDDNNVKFLSREFNLSEEESTNPSFNARTLVEYIHGEYGQFKDQIRSAISMAGCREHARSPRE